MLKFGIVGAENSHCAAIASLCNVQKKVAARAVAVWGEKPKFARAAAERAQIPAIVGDWREMLGMVDGIMIDHRHAKYHAEPAMFFVERGVPCFVDKPFTFTLVEGRRLCALARKKRVPITSFSILPMQRSFAGLKRAMRGIGDVISLTSSGPADLRSKYGGIFFYGIHQVDAIIELLGPDIDRVEVRRYGQNGIATMTTTGGAMVTMYCIKEGQRSFHCSAVGTKGIVDWTNEYDETIYLNGARTFLRMFRTGKAPFSHERMLAPVAVLEAMAKSLERGRPMKVMRQEV